MTYLLDWRTVKLFAGLAILLLAVLLWDYPIKSKTYVSGRLDDLSRISFATSNSIARVSPICGCWTDLPLSEWQGASFLSDAIEAEYGNGNEYFWVMVQNAWPSPAGDAPVTMLSFKTLRDDPLKYSMKQFSTTSEVWIYTKGPVLFHPSRTLPLAALIPAENSTTEITFSKSRDRVDISSTVRGVTQDQRFLSVGENTPTLDIMGRKVTLRVPDGSQVWTRLLPHHAEFNEKFNNQIFHRLEEGVSEVVFDVPFAARALFLDAEQPRAQGDPDDSMLGMRISDSPIALSATQPISSRRYELLKERFTRSTTVSRPIQLSATKQSMMEFRMPYIAPRVGVEVFGEYSSVTASEFVGDLAIGASPLSMRAPSDLELRHVVPITSNDEHRVSIPFNIDLENGGELNFRANASALVNGEAASNTIITFGKLIGLIATMAAFLDFFGKHGKLFHRNTKK